MKWIKLFDLNSYFSGSAAAWAAVGVSAASAAAGAYGASEQKKAAEEQEQLQNQAMEDAKAQEQRIFEQQALDAETAGQATVEFGTIDDEDDDSFGTYDDFLTPTTATSVGLGGSKTNGLGLTV